MVQQMNVMSSTSCCFALADGRDKRLHVPRSSQHLPTWAVSAHYILQESWIACDATAA